MHIFTSIDCKFWSKIIPSLSPSIAHARVKAFSKNHSQNWIIVCSSRRRSGRQRRRSAVSEGGVTSSAESHSDITPTKTQWDLPITRITQPDIFENSGWWIWVRIPLGPQDQGEWNPSSLWQKCLPLPDITASEILLVTINPTVTQYHPPPLRKVSCPNSLVVICVFTRLLSVTSFPHSSHFTWYHRN